ncbi:hypothetical protein DERF_008677 [Dermatophagoides farinae]|uniref:Uncharacterized protein n=1 Tax=Dermatophagoides farinae TaxID=6954 RepID=A0A922I252_DERFA|nr:hypothetical protein DERF_008677 [Dermatophagoides farinae]
MDANICEIRIWPLVMIMTIIHPSSICFRPKHSKDNPMIYTNKKKSYWQRIDDGDNNDHDGN